MEEHPENTYIAGQCNLGSVEIRRRKNMGWLGVGITLLIVVVLEILDVPRGYRIIVLPGIGVALSGFLQARHRFCYMYGWRGVFSISGRKQFQKVTDTADVKRDRNTAIEIIIKMLLGSLLFTALYMVI